MFVESGRPETLVLPFNNKTSFARLKVAISGCNPQAGPAKPEPVAIFAAFHWQTGFRTRPDKLKATLKVVSDLIIDKPLVHPAHQCIFKQR